MNRTTDEIESQPACWRRAAELAAEPAVRAALPDHGAEAAVVGCGTSLYIAQAYAALREAKRCGRTDAFAASEFPATRAYPVVVAISRSGTTSEVAALLAELPAQTSSVLLTAVADSPCARRAHDVILLDFADEESVVQTRFATAALVLLRASLGYDAEGAARAAEAALAAPLPLEPGTFDVVLLFTVFTSLLDDEYRVRLATYVWRVVKPGGGVLWYDFCVDNPRNPDVRGVPVKAIRRLFPEGALHCRRITLAPPLARAAVRLHSSLYALLNTIPLLRTHVLCWISKSGPVARRVH